MYEGKVVPIHAKNAYKTSRGIDACFIDLGSKMEVSVLLHCLTALPRKKERNSIFVEKALWTTEPVWTFSQYLLTLPKFEPRIAQVSQYTACSVPVHQVYSTIHSVTENGSVI
jgi:hypothetical protein